MEFKQFQQLTKRTLPKLHEIYQSKGVSIGELTYVGKKGSTVLPNILDVVHMALGLTGELDELIDAINKNDRVGIAEELADQLWYVANDLTIRKKIGFIDEGTYNHFAAWKVGALQATDGGWDPDHKWLLCNVYCVSKIVDMTKKQFYAAKPSDLFTYTRSMQYLMSSINNIAFEHNIDLGDAMQAVINKLAARYPNDFSDVAAINRDLTNERAILEGQSLTEKTADLVVEVPPGAHSQDFNTIADSERDQSDAKV